MKGSVNVKQLLTTKNLLLMFFIRYIKSTIIVSSKNRIKLQSKDLSVSFFVMVQNSQFWVELKDENLHIQTMQKSIQKIKLVQFYMQFE